MNLQLSVTENHLVHTLDLLGDPTRYKIFKLLSSNKEFCVSEIASNLSISPSAVSQHFKSFEMLGLVDKTREGQKICYNLKDDNPLVKKLIKLSKETK
jgi:DNA-binding transcriptional ArsR family regulator